MPWDRNAVRPAGAIRDFPDGYGAVVNKKTPMKEIRSVHDLEVYRLAFEAAMDFFHASKKFPHEEKYSLTDQGRRSSRSVPGNIREGFAKRRYKGIFAKQLTDAFGSAEETRTWLDFALACEYMDAGTHRMISDKYDRICAMLFKLIVQWT